MMKEMQVECRSDELEQTRVAVMDKGEIEKVRLLSGDEVLVCLRSLAV